MLNCPCQSGKPYLECCAPIIEGERSAASAVELLRARYSAFTQANIGFIVNSHHPKSRDDLDLTGTQQWAEESTWLSLQIIDINESETRTEIEFKATYRDKDEKRQIHHELSLFDHFEGAWYFTDAKPPEIKQVQHKQPKVGRNEPCPCGSGKKYKKCHARADI